MWSMTPEEDQLITLPVIEVRLLFKPAEVSWAAAW